MEQIKKTIKMTCNKKSYPLYHKDCLRCPEYNPCAKNGKWCFVAAMKNEDCAEDTAIGASEDAAMPVMRDMSTITINIGDGQTADVSMEDIKKPIEKELYSELYKGLGLMYEA